MPWQPLPRIAFAVATYPFAPIGEHDLPLEIGDDLYIIEETPNGQWLRGYLLAPPSLTAGLTSVKGQTLEARVFSGIFPRSCVEIRELLGEADDLSSITDDDDANDEQASLPGDQDDRRFGSDSGKSGVASPGGTARKNTSNSRRATRHRASESTTSAGDDNRRATRPLPHRLPGDPKPAAPVPMLRIGDESPTSVAEPLIDEIASCLREWHSTNLHELLLSRRYGSLDKVSQLIQALDLARRQFLHNVLTTKEYDELREKTVWNLVKGNKLCGGEVIVRDPQQRGRVLTGEDSVVEITKLQSVMSLLDEPPVTHTETTSLHHLMVDIRSFVGSSNEPITLLVSLVSRSVGGTVTALSESYAIEVPTGGLMGSNSKDGQMRTLFTDLTSADIGDAPSADSELFLVVKVRAPQQIMAGKPSSRSGSFSQPHAPFSKEKPPPSSSANKASRRSFMWGSTRSAFSRGGIKLDALSEQPEERPQTDRAESRDGPVPPSTAGSRGPRPSSDGTQVTHMTVDRMVGLGVLKINSIMQQTEEIEHIVTIWSATHQSSFDSQHDEECDIMVKHLLDSKTGHYERSSRAERLQVHLKPFNYQDPDALIKATPTLLSGISKTHKMGFPGAPTKPRSDIYITIHQALLARQNLLSRCGGSATSLPSNLHGNNLSVTVEVRSISGQRIDNCIYSASNSEAVSIWRSFAAERTERWNQCLRLALSPEEVMSCHVLVTLTDLPNAPFAIGYLPLWEQQAFISDGVHSLLLYKLEENSRTAQPGPVGQGGYLSAPWGPRIDQSDVTGPLATLQVESYLCSTRFSQDRVILGLLKWKEAPKDEIPGLLRQVIFVPEIEIVKLLHEVLDALFGVLVDNQENDEYEDLVFSALVRVLDIIHDRRFNLGPLVDQYAETRFNYPFATACLVRSFTRLLSKPTEPETARKLRATLKVVRYILKFITHARGQQKAKEAGIGIVNGNPGFTRHLQNIFKALDSMMRSTAPVLVGSQTLAVQHFHTWLPELTGLLTTEEILHIAIDFIDSCALVKGKLVLYKLVLIINYSKLGLFSHPDQRSALCANTARWIAPHWGETNEVTEQWKDQVRLCCSIVASQADHLGPEVPDYIPKITESFRLIQAAGSQPKNKLSLLFPASYPFPAKPISGEPVRFDEPLIELSAVLSALSNSPQGMQLELTEDDLASVLKNTLQVHMSIMQGEAFPASWLSVQIYHHKSTMKTLQYLSTIMLETFLPHPDDAESFDTELWKMFFTTLLKLVGSECLALETFPEQKRRAVWKIAGDVREDGAELLRRTWEAIGWETTSDERARYGLSKMGGYQVQYVPSLVAPIVELCLSVHEGLRRMAVEVLQTMIVSEWTLSDDLTVVQTEMIDCLDRFFKDKAMTESILQKLFVQELLDRFEPLAHIEDDAMYGGLRDLISTVDEFLDLLVAVHGGEVSGEASNLINRLRLMEFLRDMQKEEIFIRYVHQLAHLQAEGRNHTEAGLALKLHAELYEWDPTRNTRALVDPDMLEQTHFERKERIYFDMIKHFEDGEAWSSALAAYKELHNQYENNVFDFAKLARTERAIATIYETLAKSERLVPKYFKVVYKGLGFPASLRDKAFICEGSPNERTSAFTDRMQGQYQAAQIVTNGDVDSETEGQFLVVSSVSPHRDLSHPVFQRARVQQPIREYLLSAHPQMFSISSRRNTNGPVATHHAEKTLYTTAESFPTILRRSEIIDINTVHLGAKETGLERIVRKTQEMTAVEKRLGEGDEEVAQLLVDAIRISVNPKSENSVVGYRELLPKLQHKSRELDALDSDDEDSDDEDAEVEPELDEQENAIKMALVDHAIMLKRCLSSFARSTNPILRKAYQDLYMYFESTFAPEIAVFTPAVQHRDQSNTPSPTWQRSPRLHEGSPPAGQVSASGSRGVVEEAASAQPITLRQRGARLSFLGGKRKESLSHVNDAASGGGSPYTNGDVDAGNTASDKSKDNSHGPRMSFFRQGSHDNFHASHEQQQQQQQPYSNGFSHHRGTPSTSTTQDRSLKSRDIVDVVEKGFERGGEHTASVEGGVYGGDGGLLKKPSIRKRFSTLKLGTKKSKNALMGDVREE